MSTGADQTDDKIPWDDIPAERQHELLKLAETLVEEDPENAAKAQASRRDLLKAAGALGLGAAVGGGSYRAFTQPASASHGGGQVGTPSNPIDVHSATLSAQDTGSDPATDGEIRRNGSDVKVHSGGHIQNLSDMGAFVEVVKDGSNLQTAVDNNDIVKIEGTITIPSTVSVPEWTVIVGWGTINGRDPSTTLEPHGDVIQGDIAGPLLDLGGQRISIYGVGMLQLNTGGSLIGGTAELASAMSYFEQIDGFSKGDGINVSSSTSTAHEPHVRHCLFTSDSGSGSGTYGIRLNNVADIKCSQNTVRGFDTSIQTDKGGFFFLNHTYKFPAGSTGTSLVIGSNAGAASDTFILNNFFEGKPSTTVDIATSTNIHLGWNKLWPSGTGTGILYSGGASALEHWKIGWNHFEDGSTTIDISASNGWANTSYVAFNSSEAGAVTGPNMDKYGGSISGAAVGQMWYDTTAD